MRKTGIPLEQLKKSACAKINEDVIRELEQPVKKKGAKIPRQDCKQVVWMWGNLVAWSLETGNYVVKEHRFHPERMWRFDFALPDKMIGIEYEGLMSEKSGHTTVDGFTKDTEKYNAAQQLGWKVIRFTWKNYKKFISELEKQL
ncbi:PDDEXK family nuclease [Chitinophaga sancti]|uniref:DUF559 domain-containing protein n=1 Tax=Chitinophaga sancti TaxID=1004 RepID=A0A1K1LZZ7_9BACT|nr:hypothetical protein [Chitinophaga sancti]WQD64727.1 hypothetical protein U0033_10000 [Chitinophaga sancti]WQG89651.1 hypothetical protein SR876_32475 [Chitinophaga sancti]SFW16485.1 hypothetical protein SAMN05661012_00343 [Chitinophaga sancti]